MNNPNTDDAENSLEKKYKKREKKKKGSMRVSGTNVKKLQKIIKDKCR